MQAVQELALFLLGLEHAQLVHLRPLCILQKAEQTSLIYGILFIVIGVGAFLIAVVLNKPFYDKRFKSAFFGVGKHNHTPHFTSSFQR